METADTQRKNQRKRQGDRETETERKGYAGKAS